jgi:hypothetical protein
MNRVTVFEALSGRVGMALLVAALLMTVALEVLDQRAAAVSATAGRHRRPGRRHLRWGLNAVLAVLVLAVLAATAVRIFVVVQ